MAPLKSTRDIMMPAPVTLWEDGIAFYLDLSPLLDTQLGNAFKAWKQRYFYYFD